MPWHHGSEQSPIVKSTDMLPLSFWTECDKGYFRQRPFGMMSEPSQVTCCRQLISSSVGSHVRTSVLQVMVKVWKEREVDYSLRSPDCVANFDRSSSSWRTCQQSLFGDKNQLFPLSLSWGMTVDGRLYQPKKLEPTTCVDGGSFWATPTAMELPLPKDATWNKTHFIRKTGKKQQTDLSHQVRRWPTPLANDSRKGEDCAIKYRNGLPAAVKRFPTPTAQDAKNNGSQSQTERNTAPLNVVAGGRLNPTWVEWLMGYPTGWTELSAWVMEWFRYKRQLHSKNS